MFSVVREVVFTSVDNMEEVDSSCENMGFEVDSPSAGKSSVVGSTVVCPPGEV